MQNRSKIGEGMLQAVLEDKDDHLAGLDAMLRQGLRHARTPLEQLPHGQRQIRLTGAQQSEGIAIRGVQILLVQ